MTENAPGSESPFADAPAPWTCKGEAFCFFGHFKASRNPCPPPASFGDVERDTPFPDPVASGAYKAGLASLMVIRYKDTPVGPYDELIWMPGYFAVPPEGSVATRITRIYVSTKESVYNGRKNWNIPKAQAHFEFVPISNATSKGLPYSKISVSDPSDPENPFFVIELTPALLSSAIWPFSSKYFPLSMYMTYPPLPQSPNWKEDGRVGTDHWNGVTPIINGKIGMIWAKGGLPDEKFGDGVGFPDVKPWLLGVWMRDFNMTFPDGKRIGPVDTQ